MKREQWLGILKEHNIDLSLWDFKVKKELRDSNKTEIWAYKKSDTGYGKRIFNGKVDIEGMEFIYKSKEYFIYMSKHQEYRVRKLYDIKYYRQGRVLTESDYNFCLENKDPIYKDYIKGIFY